MLEAQATAYSLDTIGPVGGYQKVFVVRMAIEDLAAEERCLVVDDIVDEIVEADGVGVVLVDASAVGIEEDSVAVDNIGVAEVGTKQLFESRTVEKEIATVEELQIIAMSVCNAFIDSIVNAIVRFGAPIGYAVGVSLDKMDGAVCAASINDNPLIIRERLSADTFGCAPQSIQIIEINSYNR